MGGVITKALIAALIAVSCFAGVQTMRLAWAQAELADASQKAAEAVLEKERTATKLEEAQRDAAAARAALAQDAVRLIETGDFSNADTPIDPDLACELERLRFGASSC